MAQVALGSLLRRAGLGLVGANGLAGLALLTTPALAETSYVRAGRFVDTEKGVVLTDRLIRIDDGRVAAVTPYAPPPAGGGS